MLAHNICWHATFPLEAVNRVLYIWILLYGDTVHFFTFLCSKARERNGLRIALLLCDLFASRIRRLRSMATLEQPAKDTFRLQRGVSNPDEPPTLIPDGVLLW